MHQMLNPELKLNQEGFIPLYTAVDNSKKYNYVMSLNFKTWCSGHGPQTKPNHKKTKNK